MNCPVDGRELLMTHREGIEIDYCPDCRGVWLDRGELDKVIERSNDQLRTASLPRVDDRRDHGRPPVKKKEKKMTSLLSDLFEMG